MGISRLVVSCCALVATACGAGDSRLDPSDLELRDVLGISPEVASKWDHGQRAAARQVIEDGLHQADAVPIRASLGTDAVIDQRVVKALASVDADRARHDAGALGLVRVAIGRGELVATMHATTIDRRPSQPFEIRLSGWDAQPVLEQLPARGLDMLSAIATDAGHRSGPIVVTPAPRLAVVAGYVPASGSDPARLVVNPVLLASLEPSTTPSGATGGTASPTGVTTDPTVQHAVTTPPHTTTPPAVTTNALGNPYSFYGSVAECAAAQQSRCQSCLQNSSCTAITNIGDGNAECTQLDANMGRGYFLICIDLALAIDSVSTCTARAAPQCPRDTNASTSIATLENNANFLDDPTCGGPLDVCLATIYGPANGDFPGPGTDAGTGATQPRNTSVDCSDSCSGDSNCDDSPDCQLDGASCQDSASSDGACSDSNEQSGCSDSGGSSGGGGCSGDSTDSCGADNGNSCDNGDCGGGSSGGGCGGGDSGGCGGGGGDCGGGGGDCGGGGGDCGGGGGDCNAGGKRHGASGSLMFAVVWAFLPVPFAVMVARRARRRRAQRDMQCDEVQP